MQQEQFVHYIIIYIYSIKNIKYLLRQKHEKKGLLNINK